MPLDLTTQTNQENQIVQILKEYYPQLDAGPGTPFYELVIRPMAFLWTKHGQGVQELLAGNVLENYAAMSNEDLDRLMSQYFLTRKIGATVVATLRLIFNSRRDYFVSKDTVVDVGSGLLFNITNDYIVNSANLPGSDTDGYYVDVSILSQGIGGAYNLYANTSISPSNIYGNFSAYLRTAYIVEDSTDGGIIESNAQFYFRAKNSMSLRNLTTYRGIKAVLYDNFNLIEVVPIGLRDPEMRRDLIDLPVGENTTITVHRGGMGDIYVRPDPYSVATGYLAPLGFPYAYRGKSIDTDPSGLMNMWNNNTSFPNIDTTLRGSVDEVLPGLSPQTNMITLTSTIQPISDFCRDLSNEAIHSDNLVKQMWPVVLVISINITDTLGVSAIPLAKDAILAYIRNLRSEMYPKVGEIVHAVKNAGIAVVNLPMEITGYYITEAAQMQSITIQNDPAIAQRYPYNSVLVPLEPDSLKVTVSVPSQMSSRNITWYTNADLITVTLT